MSSEGTAADLVLEGPAEGANSGGSESNGPGSDENDSGDSIARGTEAAASKTPSNNDVHDEGEMKRPPTPQGRRPQLAPVDTSSSGVAPSPDGGSGGVTDSTRYGDFSSPSYVSSASSGTSGADSRGNLSVDHVGAPFTPQSSSTSSPLVMSTIESAVRRDSDSGEITHLPPTTQFFGGNYYDSDNSEGSFVVSYPPSGLSTPKRDRISSVDSNGSIRFLPPPSPSPSPAPLPPGGKSEKNATELNPLKMPYNERKLLNLAKQKQRQQRQQQDGSSQQSQQHQKQPLQQQQQPQHPSAVSPFQQFMPQQMQGQFSFQQQQQRQMPVPMQAQQQQFPMPMPPDGPISQHQQQHSQHSQQLGAFPFGNQNQMMQNFHPGQQHMPLPPQGFHPFPQGFGMQSPQGISQAHGMPPHMAFSQLHPHQQQQLFYQHQQQQMQQQQQQQMYRDQWMPMPIPLPNGANAENNPFQMPTPPNFASSSLPPSGPNSRAAPPSGQRSASKIPRPIPKNNSLDLMPPPPPPNHPPPPPPPVVPGSVSSQYHVRAFSSGSISSIESPRLNSSSKDDEDAQSQKPAQHSRVDSVGRKFLAMVRQWSPKQSPGPVNITDFHKRNQDFLQHRSPASNARKVAPPPPKHHRVGSMERPPASRGTHKRLASISNDDWEEGEESEEVSELEDEKQILDEESSNHTSDMSDNEQTDWERSGRYDYANENTALLPPPGISSGERDGRRSRNDNHWRNQMSQRAQYGLDEAPDHLAQTARWDNTQVRQTNNRPGKTHNKSRKKKHSSRQMARHVRSDSSGSGSEMEDSSSHDYRAWTRKRSRMLERERERYIAQWKAEAKAEAEAAQKAMEANRWYNRLARHMDSEFTLALERGNKLMTSAEAFIANLPLTIGAVAMAIVTLGVVWFKFAEENLDSCEPVHFHSSQCDFPEFPGCFYCDKTARMYRVAIFFHFFCKGFSGLLAMLFCVKVLLATQVVLDEMSSPTTASPAGLLCMTTVCVFAGRGVIGQVMVTLAACAHSCLAAWFIYMALAYNIMPEPSWFPNTVGIGLSAVKTWLYYPLAGHMLMLVSLVLNFIFFPISLVRVAINEKISATVAWLQMSAPAISLYALTIMAQPDFEEEHPDVTQFQRIHRMVYLPCMHVMCLLSVVGFLASVHSFIVRWDDFKRKEFSPAHAAFCFPTLSHANAIQAYRGAVNSFSGIRPGSWRMIILWNYWFLVLIGGTIATVWITAKFLYCLPEWTNPNLDDEEEPPAPYATMMSLQDMVTAGDTVRQHFVSPAVLQANETGALVMTRSGGDGRMRYVRTRRLPALGFEPTMNWSEMQQEREVLLEWVGKNPPRRRHRTLSVPGIDFTYGSGSSSDDLFGTGNMGVYGSTAASPVVFGRRQRRSDTASPGMLRYSINSHDSS